MFPKSCIPSRRGIVATPDGIDLEPVVVCAICRKPVSLPEATAGYIYMDGRQAFACRHHSDLRRELLRGWANFRIAQRIARDLHDLGLAPSDLEDWNR